MARNNKNSGYGQFQGLETTTGKVFMVAASTDPNYANIQGVWTPDGDGLVRLYSTITLALAACTSGRGDKIYTSPAFVTAPSLANLTSAATKGVLIQQLGGFLPDGSYVTQRATADMPQSTGVSIFTVTGPVRILDITGEVTTAVASSANSLLLCSIPTVGSSVNLATNIQMNAATVGTTVNITGTLASAMNLNANGVYVAQAAPVVVPAGVIQAVTTASIAGSIKWNIRYQPIVSGARVFVA